jgi:acyl transferase domain-containing protein
LLEVSFEALGEQSSEELREARPACSSDLDERLPSSCAAGDHIDPYTGTGGAAAACGQISHTLGLHGPNLAMTPRARRRSWLINWHPSCVVACRMALAGGAT